MAGLVFIILSGYLFFSVESAVRSTGRNALIITDVQNCFIPGGTLAIAGANQIIPIINQIRNDFDEAFDLVAFSQDWHCEDHVSFYTEHNGYNAYDVIPLYYNDNGDLCRTENITSDYAVDCGASNTQLLQQSLWPEHCVIDTTDAALHPEILHKQTDVVVRKGYHCQLDSYSVFYDNGNFGETEMNSILQAYSIDTVFVTGLARDYCVYWTSLDALELGYKTYMILDATRPVANATGEAAVADMRAKGVKVVNSWELANILGDVSKGESLHASNVVGILAFVAIVLHCRNIQADQF